MILKELFYYNYRNGETGKTNSVFRDEHDFNNWFRDEHNFPLLYKKTPFTDADIMLIHMTGEFDGNRKQNRAAQQDGYKKTNS